ncbi:MAG TPA: hypothetical protein PKK10_13915 [Woeseiaceae bacterium]|nr:hypothetical protein [Woeseiaceae bacterium]
MTDKVPVLKDEDRQTPVPQIWRNTIHDIVEAIKQRDFMFEQKIDGVLAISKKDAARIDRNIETYGCHLTSLPEETWDTSVCQWMRDYWDVLIDLFTIEEGASDLVLVLRVYEEGASHVFEIHSVHVP